MKLSDAGQYPAVSTLDEMGGIGYGYLVGEFVFVSCGNGFTRHDKSVTHYVADGGASYRDAFRGLTIEEFKKRAIAF